MIAGILFHDSGKLWENHLPENGFTMGFDERGELMGHITIGIELVNSLWRKFHVGRSPGLERPLARIGRCPVAFAASDRGTSWRTAVWFTCQPKTPEAMALNYIDNLDARMEMFAAGYLVAKPIAERIFDRVRPLPGNLVKPLEKFSADRRTDNA